MHRPRLGELGPQMAEISSHVWTDTQKKICVLRCLYVHMPLSQTLLHIRNWSRS